MRLLARARAEGDEWVRLVAEALGAFGETGRAAADGAPLIS